MAEPAEQARASETRRRLVDGTMHVIRTQGIAKVSARSIGAAAGTNQALVFYHFGSVDALVAYACVLSTGERVEGFAARLDAVRTFTDLVGVARQLHAEEQALGNVTVLGQTLAGSQGNPVLAAATGEAIALWTRAIEAVLHRLLADSPLAEIVDAPMLAQLVSASFIGIELVGVTSAQAAPAADADRTSAPTTPASASPAAAPETTTGSATTDALDRLEQLARTVDGLGPVARRALRAALRRT